MGQLFTHVIAVWLDQQNQQQTSEILARSFIETKPIVTKRKRDNHDDASMKRRIVRRSTIESDDDNSDNTGVTLSPRIAPITPKISSSPGLIRRFLNSSIVPSLSSMMLFKCQLCCRGFTDKDIYLDHMIICAIERQAPIKIVRAKPTLTRTRHDLLLTRANPIRRRRQLFNPYSDLHKNK